MPIFKKLRELTRSKEELKPYEQREKIHPLCALITIINRDQSTYYIHQFEKKGVAVTMVLYGYSMPPQEILSIIGPENTKKEILISIVRTEDVPKLKEIVEKRFKISKASKGVAFVCPIDSIGGISSYKFLADQNREIRGEKHGK